MIGLPDTVLRNANVPTVLSDVSGDANNRSSPRLALNGLTVPALTAADSAVKSALVDVRLLESTEL